jgi:hypothetical protein
MVQTKITLTLEPRDLKIINEGLFLLLSNLEHAVENPEEHMEQNAEQQQIDMFKNDSKMKASETRAIINAIN